MLSAVEYSPSSGHKASLLLGGSTYALYVGQFLFPSTVLLYTTSCVLGVGAAVIWCAQGAVLTLNSNDEDITRNSGIFTAFITSAKLVGNVFLYINLKGKHEIDSETRFHVSLVLSIVTSLGVLVFLCLRPAPGARIKKTYHIVDSLKKSLQLFLTQDMLLLSVFNFSVGLQMSFRLAIYSTCLGFTHQFGADSKALATMSGLAGATGTVLGSVLVALLSKGLLKKTGRNPVIIFGCFLIIVGYFLSFLNLPHMSTMRQTTQKDTVFLSPSKYVALLCSLLFGLADACQATQLSSLLGTAWRHNPEPAFALTKFTQSVASFLAFLCASHATLLVHLAVLGIINIAGTVAFTLVENKANREKEEECEAEDQEALH